MNLSIRSRITLFFTSIFSVLLLIAFVVIYFAHSRSRLAQIDEELGRTEALVSRLVSTDLQEGTPLGIAATEALEDLSLPGLSVSIRDDSGLVLAGDALLAAPGSVQGAVTLEGPGGTTRRVGVRHRDARTGYRVIIGRSLTTLETELASLRRALGVSLIVSLTLAVVLGFWFSGGALRPVTTMAAEARGMNGETGGARLTSARRSDELGDLGRAFNSLLDRIESTLAQQRRFMADASHELRTPVSVARTAVEVTRDRTGRSEAEYQECLGVVHEQMHRLSRIVEDLLTLARADAASLPLDVERFYLDELIAARVEEARLLVEGSGRTVELWGAEDVEICGDQRLLGQMISNLLTNAVRHGRPPGRVSVQLMKQGTTVEVAVRDSNEAIPDAERERIFGRFVRLDPSRSAEGAGLGLSIARAIALAHGGALRLLPSANEGNVFLVSLPLP